MEVDEIFDNDIDNGYLFICPQHKSLLFEGLKKQKEENYFTDFSIEVDDGFINVHKNVVCAAVPFIDAFVRNTNFADTKLDSSKICLSHLNSLAIRKIMDFIYSGELVLSGENAIDILIASDYLCMDGLKSACSNFYCQNLDLFNCVDIFKIATQYPVEDFVKKVTLFIYKNVMELLRKGFLLKLPFENVKNILCDDHLSILEDNKYPCISSRQELLLLNLLVFLHNSSDMEEKFIIKKLFENNVVRLSLIIEDQLKSVINNLRNDDLKLTIISLVKNNPIKLLKSRILSDIQYNPSPFLAISYTIGEIPNYPFNDFRDDNKLGIPQYVTSMKLYTKMWDDKVIIGGIKVWYNVGEPVLHGFEVYFDELGNAMPIHDVILEDDERIISITARAGWMLDALTFRTNRNRQIGQFGGDGGNVYIIPNCEDADPYLAYIKGIVERYHEEDDYSSAIRQIEFVWAYVNSDNQ